MSHVRIALANLPFPSTASDAAERVTKAVREAAAGGCTIVCFPECYLPGYRGLGYTPEQLDQAALEQAWTEIAETAKESNIAVILGTERFVEGQLRITALVINADGTIAGFQDKVQLDPSEEGKYSAGSERSVFQAGPLIFGISICHEGWRYPETVRWSARRGAHVVFHPHFHPAEPGSFRPATFADPANSFHEKAALCRAAENTIFFATINYATDGAPTTSAIVRPDGTLQQAHPYSQPGLLIADIDLSSATGLLASRCKTNPI